MSDTGMEKWVTCQGKGGSGRDKHIVLVSGDEEYRSEEGLPMLARLLAHRHGFDCTVLFAINPETGQIDPETLNNIPGLHHLENADLMVILLRFRELPDDQMKRIIDFIHAGKPVIALRTSTHAFRYLNNVDSPFAKYDCENEDFDGGFGRQILGETWVAHHGDHGTESTRGVLDETNAAHSILRGVKDIWVPSDVYAVGALTGSPKVLIWGQVLSGMNPTDKPSLGKEMMPVAWVKKYRAGSALEANIFTTTMGSSVDLLNEGLRRMLVNGCYWATGLESDIVEGSNVNFVGEYKPSFFGFGTYAKGVYPSDPLL